MSIKKDWQLSQSQVTNENLFLNRREFIKLGAAVAVSTATVIDLSAKALTPEPDLQFLKDSNPHKLSLNTYEQITSYNNFYEFTTSKQAVSPMARNFNSGMWKITIDGLVEKPFEMDMDDLMKMFPLEERIYRFRCVEGWSMVVPWIGFELSTLIKHAKPLSSAKYIRFETLYDPKQFPDQARGEFATIEYPYVEGLRMDEAMNELSFIAVGLYGHTLPAQNGAPIRLVVPWKYGFKSIKSIVKISFTDKEPLNTWQKIAPKEYGFYANVNPMVDHPRWSQKRERVLGKFFKQETLLYNGYEEEVASLYKNLDLKRFF